jgi:hypothetical protein
VKLYLYVFIFIFFLAGLNNAQIITPTRFPIQEQYQNNTESFLLGLPNNELVMFWYDSSNSQIKYSRSPNSGNWWYDADSLINILSTERYVDINGVVLPSGRVLITYHSNFYYYIYSDDNCYNWSIPTMLPTRSGILARRKIFKSSLAIKANNQVCFIHSVSPSFNSEEALGIYTISSVDGVTWTIADTIDLSGKNGYIANINGVKDLLVFQDSTENNHDIFMRTTTNSGITWSERTILVSDNLSQSCPTVIKDYNGKIWVYYKQNEATPFDGIMQSDIKFISSTDSGINWSTPQKFTKYIGYDESHNLSLWNGRPMLSFISSRNFSNYYGRLQIYFTLADVEVDTNVPPFLYKSTHTLTDPYPNEPYFIRAFVDDDREIVSVKLNTYTNPPGVYETLDMYDDGMHNDSLPGDKIYGVEIIPQNFGDFISYYFSIEDNDLNIATFDGGALIVPLVFATDAYLIDVNNFKLPIDNRGILADANVNGISGGRFEGNMVLFSAGFYLSGYNNGLLWANGIASASLVEDYQAGPVGSEPTDPVNKLYILKNSDPPFGDSWIQYQYAVDLGADFYDGNADGVYNPVDLNNNNLWDVNEDRPDILGDVTAWCVFNDGVPSSSRRWNDSQPMGIEIQQTVFAWGENVIDPIDNMIFVRYRLVNKGTVSDKFDDVYFSCYSDPDLGDFEDDLVGCDTSLNLGYLYNQGEDEIFGQNPPALGIPFLQGPSAYIPGETFIDNNGNLIYDEGIDVPLDTAYMNNGPVIGVNILPGARNQGLSSFIHYMSSHPTMGDPANSIEARNYILGFDKNGNIVDPCTWNFGSVFGGIDCATVDPRYLYSGNRVNQIGWINIWETDQRMLANTGPFVLELNKPVDVLACYLVGRGENALNSIDYMKEYSTEAIQIYQSNFTDIPTNVENQPSLITEYKLSQNYPNPFNPSTKISWQSPIGSWQTLKVFDVLGNEVATLVDEYRIAGSYEIDFNSSALSSGVYFYRLQAGSFVQTRKMILIK